MTGPPVLEVDGLRVLVQRGETWARALDDVSFSLPRGSCLGIVGESGCGKSLTLRALIGLLPEGARQVGGELRFSAEPVAAARPVDPAELAGHGIALVFQDSHGSLDPTMRVGSFIAGAIRHRRGCSRAEARQGALELLAAVGVPDPELRSRAYPHELSGGLRQRVAIALALATDPEVLLCDEPTSALDVTVQAQILALLQRARAQHGLSLVFVSHDVAAVRQIADVIAVMYAGQIVEFGSAAAVLDEPRHPYTRALVRAVPTVDGPIGAFASIPGSPPDPLAYGTACRFAERCGHCDAACLDSVEPVDGRASGHRSACVHERALVGEVQT